jgi:hypothetical protein
MINMEKSMVALCTSAPECNVIEPGSLPTTERLRLLEEQIYHLQRVISAMQKEARYSDRNIPPPETVDGLNKDGIPIGTKCYGRTEKSPFLSYLTVAADCYTIGATMYPSLSAAAEAVSSVRRSGWTFWKPVSGGGMTLKELYRN